MTAKPKDEPAVDSTAEEIVPTSGGLDAELAIAEARAIGTLTEEKLTAGVAKLIASLLMKPKGRQPTAEEVALFIGQCIRTQLDPFAGQICAVYRNDNGRQVLGIQTQIGGFRLIAERTKRYEGGTSYEWCSTDGQWTDVWTAADPPHAARVGVWKKGSREPTYGTAYWAMYKGNPGPLWRVAGGREHMLGKCAEAIALRRAFPQELSGIYTVDEMGVDYEQARQLAAGALAPPESSLPPALTDAEGEAKIRRARELYDQVREAAPGGVAVNLLPGRFHQMLSKSWGSHAALDEFVSFMEAAVDAAKEKAA